MKCFTPRNVALQKKDVSRCMVPAFTLTIILTFHFRFAVWECFNATKQLRVHFLSVLIQDISNMDEEHSWCPGLRGFIHFYILSAGFRSMRC